jgi:hypothetical protein
MNPKLGILLLIALAAVRADTVELKTGEKIEGKFKQATNAGAVIEVGGQPLTFPLEKVRAIYLGGAPDAAKANSSTTEALDALRGLQSVTASGVSYRDYAPRVLDAKVKVDRYLASPTAGNEATRNALGAAMRYYELASQAWNGVLSTTNDSNTGLALLEVGTALTQDPALSNCLAIQKLIQDADQRKMFVPSDPGFKRPLGIGIWAGQKQNLPAFWSCAASKIAEAEKP